MIAFNGILLQRMLKCLYIQLQRIKLHCQLIQKRNILLLQSQMRLFLTRIEFTKFSKHTPTYTITLHHTIVVII